MVSIFSVQTSTSPTAGWSISVSAVMDFSYIPEHHAHSFSTVSESKTATEAPPAAPTVLAANTANMSTQDGGQLWLLVAAAFAVSRASVLPFEWLLR